MTTPADPRAEFQHFPRNPRFYAGHWLIAARLDKWIASVNAAGILNELRSELERVAA